MKAYAMVKHSQMIFFNEYFQLQLVDTDQASKKSSATPFR